jgi:glutamate racemase
MYSLPIIGLEPALKPAVEAYPSGHVLLLATPVTLRLDKFKKLLKEYGCGNVSCISAPELVTFVERGEADTPCAVAYLKKLFAEHYGTRFDACVLGCTHFPFARNAIVKALGYEPAFFEGSHGAARRLKSELENKKLLNGSKENGTVLFNENIFDITEAINNLCYFENNN